MTIIWAMVEDLVVFGYVTLICFVWYSSRARHGQRSVPTPECGYNSELAPKVSQIPVIIVAVWWIIPVLFFIFFGKIHCETQFESIFLHFPRNKTVELDRTLSKSNIHNTCSTYNARASLCLISWSAGPIQPVTSRFSGRSLSEFQSTRRLSFAPFSKTF